MSELIRVVEALLCLYDHDTLQIKFEVHLNKEIVICGAIQIFSTLNRSKIFIIVVASKKGLL